MNKERSAFPEGVFKGQIPRPVVPFPPRAVVDADLAAVIEILPVPEFSENLRAFPVAPADASSEFESGDVVVASRLIVVYEETKASFRLPALRGFTVSFPPVAIAQPKFVAVELESVVEEGSVRQTSAPVFVVESGELIVKAPPLGLAAQRQLDRAL